MSSPSDATAPVASVYSLAGNLLAEVQPVPGKVRALKLALEERLGCPPALQRLVQFGAARVYGDEDPLDPQEGVQVVMVVDETPLHTWDLAGNPAREQLSVEGATVTCPGLRTDCVNVLTREPVRRGAHYFEFHMHHIGDEQWCGLVSDPEQAGSGTVGRRLSAWSYYAGRMHSQSRSIIDGQAALHAEGRAVAKFRKLRSSGDVIGMLVDMDRCAVAFDLNGELQGACAIPGGSPMWVFTHLDTPDDHVELRKPSLQDAPPRNLEALTGALLRVSDGESLSYRPYGGYYYDSVTAADLASDDEGREPEEEGDQADDHGD